MPPSNNAQPSGNNQNVIINEVTDSNISLLVNSVIKNIPNELAALKELLVSNGVQGFQYAHNIYNIGQICEANFSFATGRVAFNEFLTKQLTQALILYNPRIPGLAKIVREEKYWEKRPNINNWAKDVISNSFTGVLGIQLRKLIAIGKRPPSEEKNHKYIKHCIITCKRALQLLCFNLLSELWNIKAKKNCDITMTQREALKGFFENEYSQDIEGTIHLLEHVFAIFTANSLDLPIHEFNFLSEGLQPDNNFKNACKKLHALNKSLEEFSYSPLDCFEAETQITHVLTDLAFLSNYSMISMKRIGYDELRNNPPYFLHCYITLGTKINSEKYQEVFSYEKEPVCTDAIFLYKEHYNRSINLFPFVVDMNALNMEGGTKICFLDSVNHLDSSLNYVFLEDNSPETIRFLNMSAKNNDINEIMNDLEKRKLFKLDTVFLKFQEAKKCILNE